MKSCVRALSIPYAGLVIFDAIPELPVVNGIATGQFICVLNLGP
jgi:hypothetical protein